VLTPPAVNAAAYALTLTVAEYARVARESAEMLAELTRIHIAVDESGDAAAHQEQWGALTAEHTRLRNYLYENGFPPPTLASELNARWIPPLLAAVQQAEQAIREHDAVDSGLRVTVAEARAIIEHLQHHASEGALAAVDPAGPDAAPPAGTDAVATTLSPATGGAQASDPVPLIPVAGWNVTVDPSPLAPSPDVDLDLKIKVPGVRSATEAGLLYPLTPSPYALLGTNQTPRETADVWNLSTRTKLGTVRGITLGGSQVMALSADGRYFAAQPLHERTLGVFDVQAGKVLGTLALNDWTPLPFLAFGSDNMLVYIDSGHLGVASVPGLKLEKWLPLPAGLDGKACTLSPGGRYFTCYGPEDSGGAAVQAYEIASAERAGVLTSERRLVSLSYAPDGRLLAGLSDRFDETTVSLWDVATGSSLGEITLPGGLTELVDPEMMYRGPGLTWFPGNDWLLLAGRGVLDRQTGQLLLQLPGKVRYPMRPVSGRQVAVLAGQELVAYTISDELQTRAESALAAGGTSLDAQLPPLTRADRSGLTSPPIDPRASVPWSVPPDPQGARPSAGAARQSFTIPAGIVYRACMASPEAARVAVMYSQELLRVRGSNGWGLAPTQSPVTIELYDLRRGSRLSSYELPFPTSLESLSPRGTWAVTRILDGMDRLDVWDLDRKQHVCGFRPYQEEADERARDVVAAAFLDDSQLMTMNSRALVVWSIPDCRARYEILLEGLGQPTLSPNRKHFALLDRTARACLVFDSSSGSLLGRVDCPRPPARCGFHPAGDRLAIVMGNQTGGEVLLVNMGDGTQLDHFPVPRSGTIVQWIGEGHLLIGGEGGAELGAAGLVSLSERMLTWTYRLPLGQHLWDNADGKHWYLSARSAADRNWTLAGVMLPESEVATRLREQTARPGLLLEPGGALDVRIEVSDPPGESDFASRVRENIVRKYTEAGIQVQSAHPLVLTITSEQGSTGQELEFRRIGPQFHRPGDQSDSDDESSVNVTEEQVTWKVAVTHAGRPMWDTRLTFTNAAFMVFTGQSGDVASQTQDQLWASAARALLEFDPPLYIFPQETTHGLGVSQLTPRGSVPVTGRP
jgi:hypothetical protein